ncbi:MAG: PEP-CTERM sorting domain-containing protein [Acidobacteria bacterium]|nr:PEP-CTERM sorting domain-containing protein [Acidobacteriota bacterium]
MCPVGQVQQTTVSGTMLTETFNALPTGNLNNYFSLIGQYSNGAVISDPNAWGGAGQTRYIAVGSQSQTTTYNLNFFAPLDYFGLSWQAGDTKNELRFYNQGSLVQSFGTATIFGSLPSTYNANPNTGQNAQEKYAFINFFGTKGTAFDRIEFYNNGFSTGFETDNHTIRGANSPTVEAEAPEPATFALVGAAALAIAYKRRKQ